MIEAERHVRRRLLVLVPILVLTVLLGSGIAVAKPGGGGRPGTQFVTYDVAVYVRAAFGGPVADAKVTVYSKDSHARFVGTTDATGYVFFSDVPGGEYVVDTEHHDYRYSRQALTVPSDVCTVVLHRVSSW